jgi:ATP-binding cassette, subfamily B, bacterial
MQNPYLSLLGKAWQHARNEKRRFILIYAMFILANMIVALNPLFYGWFVNQLQQHGAEVLKTTWMYVAGFLLLRLAEWIFHGPARVMERQLAFRISKNYMEQLYHKVLHLSLDWHQENHSGSTISKVRKAYEALRDFFQQGFIYLYSFGKFVFSFGAMIYFSPLFGGIGVLLGFITILIILRFDKPFIQSLREVNAKEHEVSSNFFDGLSNIRTVVTLKLEKSIHEGLMSRIADVFPPFKRNVTINEWKWFTAQMMVGIIYCVSVFGYVYQHWTPGETFQIGGLIILIGYVNQFTSVFNDIASQYTQIVKYNTEIQNAAQIEDAFESVCKKASVEPLPQTWRSIDISNLNYSRKATDPEKKAAGLTDFKLRISKGQRIALIGESGSGKSTLLSLLRGLHKVNSGSEVLVDRKKIDFESIASTVTLFPQEPEIFESTIHYNLTLGLPFSEDEIMKACEEAHFADVVKELPDGLATHIAEKGVNLSGGQKQRLALARGILACRSSEIILMDEPTSSVDPRTEKMIYTNLFKSFENKAVVSSLHRLHLLTSFDYVYILKNGTVIDEGTFEDLKRYSLVFKEMLKHQDMEEPETEQRVLNVAL